MRQIIGNDKIGPDAYQPLALPVIYFGASGLFRRNADGYSADQFHLFDLDVTIAKAEDLASPDIGLGNNPLNQNLFEKL